MLSGMDCIEQDRHLKKKIQICENRTFKTVVPDNLHNEEGKPLKTEELIPYSEFAKQCYCGFFQGFKLGERENALMMLY